MGYVSEEQLENKLIAKLESMDYDYVEIDTYDDLIANLKIQLEKLNSEKLESPLSDTEFKRVLNFLLGKTVFVSAKQLRDKFILERDNGEKVPIYFLDEISTKNIYQVTHQITVERKYTNRYDVTILVNGLPLVQIELKRAGIDINEAINQINRYKLHSFKGILHYIQLFVVSNAIETRYFSNTDDPRFLRSLTFYWTDEKNNRICNLNEFSSIFFNQNKLIKMITEYMILSESEKSLMVMRPYQIYATEALVSRAIETDKGGFICHTTGSGKTLTSFKCSQLLIKNVNIKKVIFLVDRADLDSKTIDDFNSFEANSVDMTDNTFVLIKQLKGKDKLIVSTIQKMATAIRSDKYKKQIEFLKDEKIIFIFDECHRSQAGEMHVAIDKFFNKAQFFGFTGTPIFKENILGGFKTTADLFGKCLHSYLISDAIADKNVLGFNVEYIKTYDGKYDEDDETMVEDIDTAEVLENDERISLIVKNIIKNHNAKTINRRYTSIFATSSIPMLVKYYDKFKQIKHDLKIAGVFSFGTNEDLEDKEEHSRDQLERIINDYNKMFGTNFSTATYDSYNRDIANRLKTKKMPQIDILIVVNMYLTGFDSRALNTLYVDKNLTYHSLLQAYSRTNRVEKDTKQFGNIVCYRNLKKNTDKALKLFGGGGDLSQVLTKPYEFYVDQFNTLTEKLINFAPNAEMIIEDRKSEDEQVKFVNIFRELMKAHSIVKTFTVFDWEDLKLSEQEYENYESSYYTIYNNVIKRKKAEKTSILSDINFCIELIDRDKVNFSYILNLIKDIDISNPKKDIDYINTELNRSTEPQLKKKIDLIKLFLADVLPKLKNRYGIEILEEYLNYESEVREKEIDYFVEENGFNKSALKEAISEYEYSQQIKDDLMTKIMPSGVKFLAKRKIISKIQDFIKNNCDEYYFIA